MENKLTAHHADFTPRPFWRARGASKAVSYVVTELDDSQREVSFKGRDAWALDELLQAGEDGCTPIDHPGPRWSHCVWKLRGGRISIDTVTEAHDARSPGHHARYILRSQVRRA